MRGATVLATGPLALIGVALIMAVFRIPFGFVAMLGGLSLFGMVLRNSVILIDQIESDRAISEAADFIADYLGVERDNPRLRVFIAAVGGMMFHIANGTEDVRDGRFLETLLEAIDLLEQGLPL